MFLIPVAPGESKPRPPWMTSAFLAACLAVQVIRSTTAPSDEARVEALVQQRKAEDALLEARHVAIARRGEDPARREALRAVRSGGASSEEERPLVDALREADQKVEAIERRDLGMKLAWRPSLGPSLRMVLNAFAHGGFGHLFGNAVFLWIFGAHLEALWGARRFSLLFFPGAVAANAMYGLFHPGSDVACLGASGAISAAVGAFLVCYRRAEVRFWYGVPAEGGFRTGTFDAFATWLLPLWVVDQLAMTQLEAHDFTSGVAYSAHFGGLLFGAAFALAARFTGFAPMPASFTSVEELDAAPKSDDPEVEKAKALLAKGDSRAAIATLQAVLQRAPFDAVARPLLLDTALAVGDLGIAGPLAAEEIQVLLHLRRPAEALALFARISPVVPDASFSDKALAAVFRAAKEAGDETAALAAVRKLVAVHAKSPLTPRVLLEVAELHENAGRAPAAEKTLRHLVTAYSGTIEAEEAERRLSVAAHGSR